MQPTGTDCLAVHALVAAGNKCLACSQQLFPAGLLDVHLSGQELWGVWRCLCASSSPGELSCRLLYVHLRVLSS